MSFKDFPAELSAEEYVELLKNKMCQKCGQKKEDNKKDKSDKGDQKKNGKSKSNEQQGQEEKQDNDGGEQESECGKCSSCGNPTKNGQGEGQNGEGKGGGRGVIDDHSWDDASDEAKSIARERMREILREAMNEINGNSLGWGSTPNSIKEKIIKFVNGTIDWKKILQYFIQSSIKANKKNSIKKINKRFPYIHAGRTHNRTANIAISIDQSGSVGDEMLEAFFGELNNLASIVTFTVIPFDCEVDEKLIEVWKKGQRQTAKRVKHGGTDFDAPTKYVNEAGIFDAHIILTDMQAPKPVPSRVPRMWMTTESCMGHIPFSTNERVIPIVIKK
jgi:predicted metal-dependent peptidase